MLELVDGFAVVRQAGHRLAGSDDLLDGRTGIAHDHGSV